MYVVHDNEGTILHSISGPDANYGKALTAADQQWIFLEGPFEFNPVTQYVDVEKKAAGASHAECLVTRTSIPLTVDGTTVSGIPTGSKVKITSGVGVEFEGVVSDGEVELNAADPTTYTVNVTAGAKYLPTSIQVVAE